MAKTKYCLILWPFPLYFAIFLPGDALLNGPQSSSLYFLESVEEGEHV